MTELDGEKTALKGKYNFFSGRMELKMTLIEKSHETMTSKQRVQKTFCFEKTDRVTIGYEANAAIHNRLSSALEINNKDNEALLQALGVDYRGVSAAYSGPALYIAPKDRQVDPIEGCIMRRVEHDTGGYWDFCDFPLIDADEEEFAKFPIPNADNFNYDDAYDYARTFGREYGLYVGGAGVPDVINSSGRVMGMEDVLCHLITQYPPAVDFINRRCDFLAGRMERTLDKCKGLIDFVWLGEDLGTQIAPMISLELYRTMLKPIHKRFVDIAAAYNIPTIIHTCGSSCWAYEDFIEMGIKGVDTLQPEAANMSPAYLTQHFGGRLNFRGCISTAGPLAYGTAKETEQICKDTLEIMMPYRGYHFAPTHAIQDNSPVENVIAMYNAVHKYGCY